jgi:LysM repeat protein
VVKPIIISMKKIILLLIIFFIFSRPIYAQYITAGQYVAQYKDLAVREMKRMGVPAAISLAQGLLETENGNSDLLKKSNNHFGIKCKSTWTAEGVSHDDDAPGECFRVYKSAEDSYRDHSNFLRGSARYAFLFKLDPRDYKGWAYGLRKAGYATNPKYPDILIKNIEDNNLEQYTQEGAGEIPVFDASKYTDDPEDKNISDVLKSAGQTGKQADASSDEPIKVTINGSKALFVNKGTSLLAVATQNNINLAHLLEINDLQNDGLLDKDQYVFLEKKERQGSRDYYVSQPDETWYDVAQKNGVVLQSLYDCNNVSPGSTLYAGTKILLKPGLVPDSLETTVPAAKETSYQTSSNGGSRIHYVQPKESLYAISKKYGVSIDQLREWNNLKDNNLQVGQRLIISK